MFVCVLTCGYMCTSVQIGKWQSVEGEEAVSHELVDMVDQMRNMLVQAAHTSESVPSVQQAIRGQPRSVTF